MKSQIRSLVIAVAALIVAADASADVLKIVVDDMIHPISQEFISNAIQDAVKANDKAVLIELRTPGGLERSTRKIVNAIFDSPVPVIVWIAPPGSRAASAGFFILESADIAAMAPGTNTGAAHPVVLGGEKLDEVMKQKMENDSAAFMRSIAHRRNRNVQVAESAVVQSKSFTDQEALQQNLIDLVARDQEELFRSISQRTVTRFDGKRIHLDLTSEPVRTKEMSVREEVLSFIMDPNVAFVLFALGMLGLWAEFNNPGAILPGVVGTLSILLAVFALNILPTRYAAFALILLAFVLFILEAKFTSHGVLGIGGVVSMFVGGLLLVDGPIPEMRVHWITALAVSVPFGIIAVFLMTLVIRAHRRHVTTGEQGMVGEIGTAETVLDPSGRIFVHGEIWTAVSSRPVKQGGKVVVRGMSGLELTVEPVETSAPQQSSTTASGGPPADAPDRMEPVP